MVGWRAEKTFSAGVLYRGIPYTQTEFQQNRNGFINSLGNGDFYSYYERFGWRMPKYGNDCSAFVSFSMGLARKTTYDFIAGIKSGLYPKAGSYNAYGPSYYELVNAYRYLQPGDAVVNDGHTFLINYNDPSNGSIQAYEQTPYNATYTYWGYAQMANGAYMPFSKK